MIDRERACTFEGGEVQGGVTVSGEVVNEIYFLFFIFYFYFFVVPLRGGKSGGRAV